MQSWHGLSASSIAPSLWNAGLGGRGIGGRREAPVRKGTIYSWRKQEERRVS
jgi:hypothetical protein